MAYRVLKRRFALDDEYIEDLKADLIDAKRLAADEDGKVLVWVSEGEKAKWGKGEKEKDLSRPRTAAPGLWTPPHLAERILAEQAALEARGAADGERKTITALFADIKGSIALMEDLDPEEARSLIDPALKLMIDAVHRYEGYVVQSTGDGIFAFFGAPIAHEDHPQRALAEQGQEEEGIAYLRQGLAASEATGGVQGRAYCLALLAEAYGKAGQTEEGLTALAEALATIHKNGERHFYAAELYRLKGQLTLQKFRVPSFEFPVTNPQPPTPKRRRKPKRAFRRPLRLPGGRVRSR